MATPDSFIGITTLELEDYSVLQPHVGLQQLYVQCCTAEDDLHAARSLVGLGTLKTLTRLEFLEMDLLWHLPKDVTKLTGLLRLVCHPLQHTDFGFRPLSKLRHLDAGGPETSIDPGLLPPTLTEVELINAHLTSDDWDLPELVKLELWGTNIDLWGAETLLHTSPQLRQLSLGHDNLDSSDVAYLRTAFLRAMCSEPHADALSSVLIAALVYTMICKVFCCCTRSPCLPGTIVQL
jgi:hypothetical protein